MMQQQHMPLFKLQKVNCYIAVCSVSTKVRAKLMCLSHMGNTGRPADKRGAKLDGDTALTSNQTAFPSPT